jgi:hypothetical protein
VRRTLLIALAALLSLSLVPAGAEEAPDPGCDPAVGRELLTPDGFAVTVESAPGYNDNSAVRDATENRTVPFRNGEIHLQAELGEAERARVAMTMEWEDPTNDFDLIVLNDRGFAIAQSEDENLGGEAREELTVALRDCQRITVWVRSYLGAPGQPIDLTIDVEPETDPGEVAADTRTILYAGGDPGQLSMAHSFDENTAEVPFRGTLVEDRPTGFLPNSYTRAVVGSITELNPFQPHFSAGVERRDLSGPASAVVYLSTPLQEAELEGGEVLVRLLIDGAIRAEEAVPMPDLRDVPQAFFIDFGEVERTVRSTVSVDVVAQPAASPNNPDVVGDPADAAYTLWYGSMQFPTRLILP